MPTPEVTILLKARDELSGALRSAGGGMDRFKKAAMATGVALTAAGAGLEAMARKQAPLLEATKKLAVQTGLTEGEIRGMATSLSNATFPLEDAIDLMGQASQQGLEGADALQSYANFWDMVGDATGNTSTTLAQSAAALKAVGIEAGQETELLGAFGLIMTQTSGDVQGFLQFVERLAPEMGKANVSVDDAAVFMTALEKELGLTAKTARTEFKEALEQAIAAADGQAVSLDEVAQSLGLTQSQLEKYRGELANSTDIVKANADAHASTKTKMQQLQSTFGDLTFKMGPYIQQASQIAPILMVIGPAMMALSAAKNVYTGVTKVAAVATRLFGVALKGAMGPVGLILIAITALIAIGVLLWKNWDVISAKAKEIWGAIKAFFTDTWNFLVSLFKNNWEKILLILFPAAGLVVLIARNWGAIKDKVKEIWGAVVGLFKDNWDKILLIVFPAAGLAVLIARNWGAIKDKVREIWGVVVGFVKDNWDKILGILFPPVGIAVLIKEKWGAITDVVKDIWDAAASHVKGAINTIIGAINSFIRGVNAIEVRFPGMSLPFGKSIGAFTIGLPNIPEVTPLKTGGIVRQPTLALLGEAGPEIVLPLNRAMGRVTINGPLVSVTGSVLGTDLEDLLELALIGIERRTGVALRSS